MIARPVRQGSTERQERPRVVIARPVRQGSTERQERPWVVFDANNHQVIDCGPGPDLQQSVLLTRKLVEMINNEESL